MAMLKMIARGLARSSTLVLRQGKSTATPPIVALQSAHAWRRLPGLPANGRSFTVSATSTSSALVDALQSELDYEKDVNESETQIPAPPSGWKLEDEPGTSVVQLTKQYKGEDITIELSVSAQITDEEAVEEDADPEADVDVAIDFIAIVKKGDKELSFDLRSDGSYLEITDVALLDDSDDSEEAYEGPKYAELDDKLHEAFSGYLEERGINADLGDYLLQLADNKEQTEYVRWLKQVHKFVKS